MQPVPSLSSADGVKPAVAQLESFQRPLVRVDEPEVFYTVAGINIPFSGAVQLAGGWRQRFANPLGRNFDEGTDRTWGYAFPEPCGSIGDDNVVVQVDFRVTPLPLLIFGVFHIVMPDTRRRAFGVESPMH